jgi:hypothetical protein
MGPHRGDEAGARLSLDGGDLVHALRPRTG